MKLELFVCLVLAVFVSIGGIRLTQAQTDRLEKADIPFDFYAAGEKMAAGSYIIGVDAAAKWITLSDAPGEHKIFLIGIPSEDGYDKSELVFVHSGNTYALKEVKSDVIDLKFKTRVPEQAIESRAASPHVVVALNRQ
jgi:hypothetical protein